MEPLIDWIASSPVYAWLAAAAVGVSIFLWFRITRRNGKLLAVYVGALAGGFLGAKLTFLAAEGWLHWGEPDWRDQLIRGKTILGALLGGYLAVEIVKKFVGLRNPTGDFFATIIPLGLIVARFGCLAQGCCLGIPQKSAWYTLTDESGASRWPAVPVEMGFNFLCLVIFHTLRKEKVLPGQHFHLYLIAYGTFRFFHEFVRDTPRLFGPISGYQIAAVLVGALGLLGFLHRRSHRQPLATP